MAISYKIYSIIENIMIYFFGLILEPCTHVALSIFTFIILFIIYIMFKNYHLNTLTFISIILLITTTSSNLVDNIIGRQYAGDYNALQSTKTFNYLDGKSGRILALFYGSPNRESVNSMQMVLLDPKYEDGKAILIDVKSIIEVNTSTESWSNSSHSMTVTTIQKQRQQDSYQISNVNSFISFEHLDTEDYQEVVINIIMKGENFQIIASFKYYNQVISTMVYSIYVTAVVVIQIYCAFMLLKIMDAPNFVFSSKISLLTLSLCNIEDFSQTMTHIQYIMSSQSGYLFFVFPSLAFIILFIIFDMKMLFLVWRSHNLVNMDNPQMLRKKLTAFYIQFYLGLFAYLTLSYFFSNDTWMIILKNLILVPQIVHNIRLVHKPGFNLHYIIGYLGSRLLIPFYQRTCPQNRFKLTPNITLVVILIALYLAQVLLLALQWKLGSRFFVPKRFLPNYYNYRCKMNLNESTRELQCAICIQNLFDAEPSKNHALNFSQIDSNLLEEITVMNTPCNHKFHEQCLSQWMQVKLQCPTCRKILPPI